MSLRGSLPCVTHVPRLFPWHPRIFSHSPTLPLFISSKTSLTINFGTRFFPSVQLFWTLHLAAQRTAFQRPLKPLMDLVILCFLTCWPSAKKISALGVYLRFLKQIENKGCGRMVSIKDTRISVQFQFSKKYF